jgi:hypothetical protein
MKLKIEQNPATSNPSTVSVEEGSAESLSAFAAHHERLIPTSDVFTLTIQN